MRTTKKEVTTAIRLTILESIDLQGYDLDNIQSQDKAGYLYVIFQSEYLHQYNRHRYSEQENFTSWLQGLPSSINLPMYNDGIIYLMVEEWNLPQPANKTDSDSIELFYYLIYREFKKLVNKYQPWELDSFKLVYNLKIEQYNS